MLGPGSKLPSLTLLPVEPPGAIEYAGLISGTTAAAELLALPSVMQAGSTVSGGQEGLETFRYCGELGTCSQQHPGPRAEQLRFKGTGCRPAMVRT